MKINISKGKEICERIFIKLGFDSEESKLSTENIIEAELTGRKSHGFSRIVSMADRWIKADVLAHGVKITKEKISVIRETANSLYFNGKYKPGFYLIYKTLEKAIPKARQHGIVSVGIKNAGYCTGFIGAYARKATENNLIYIGFHSTFSDMFPFGSKKPIFGTNPITIGIPANHYPVILDMATAKSTIGDIVIARNEGRSLKQNIALDKEGKPTVDPLEALSGGVLPIAEHKGSGLAFVIQLLAGALTGSAVGYAIPGGWGSFYILLNPECFRPIKEFKNDIQRSIRELKDSPKAKGFKEIFYPGERSAKLREKTLEQGYLEINDDLYQRLIKLS